MAEMIVTGLTVCAGSATLVENASLTVRGGEVVAVIGENGAGKTSLLRGIIGFQGAAFGQVAIDGRPMASMSAVERARTIAWLPQSVPLAWPIRVRDAIALGRFAHGGLPSRIAETDRIIVEQAMTDCDVAELAERSTVTLSGGEIARVHLARCLVTQARLLLADEPVAALDPRHRIAVMGLLREMTWQGAGVLVVMHDLGLAARFADRVIAMKHGRIVVEGSVADVMTPPVLNHLFDINFAVDDSMGWPQPAALGQGYRPVGELATR